MDVADPSDLEAYRFLARHWAASVTVITCRRRAGPFTSARPELDGFTATHFFTVSMAPPLLVVSAAKDSGAWDLLREADVFTVNLLSEKQSAVALAFARTQSERGAIFQDFPWAADAERVPVLDGTLGAFSARLHSHMDAGDHVLVMGAITQLHLGTSAKPVLFQNRAFWKLAPSE